MDSGSIPAGGTPVRADLRNPAVTGQLPVIRCGSWRFAPSLAASVATVCLFPLLCGLGFWQLERAAQKERIIVAREARGAEPELSLDSPGVVLDVVGDEFRRVRVTGKYLGEMTLFLDNRVHAGVVGYHLYTPLQLTTGERLMVNRGWVPAGGDRSRLPVIETPTQTLTLTGRLRLPPRAGLVLQEEIWTEWPQRVQSLDVDALAEVGGRELLPLVLLPDPPYADGEVPDWPAVTLPPQRHRGYAVQWFAMAAALLGLYLYWSIARAPGAIRQGETDGR